MTPTPTTTGPGSTSFAVWLVTFLGGVASAVEGIVTPGTAAHTATYGGVGALVALASTIAKLFHDKGLHVATIQTAGSDIAAQLPQLQHDAAIATAFVEQDVPGLKARMDALEAKAASVVAPLAPDRAAIETVVRSVLAGVAPAPAPVEPPPVA